MYRRLVCKYPLSSHLLLVISCDLCLRKINLSQDLIFRTIIVKKLVWEFTKRAEGVAHPVISYDPYFRCCICWVFVQCNRCCLFVRCCICCLFIGYFCWIFLLILTWSLAAYSWGTGKFPWILEEFGSPGKTRFKSSIQSHEAFQGNKWNLCKSSTKILCKLCTIFNHRHFLHQNHFLMV